MKNPVIMNAMNKWALYVSIAVILFVGSFLLLGRSVNAGACTDKGTFPSFTITPSNGEVTPTQNVMVSVTFQWAGTATTECVAKPVELRFRIKRGSNVQAGSFKLAPLGRLSAPAYSAPYSFALTHAMVKEYVPSPLQDDSSMKIFVEAVTDESFNDTLATSAEIPIKYIATITQTFSCITNNAAGVRVYACGQSRDCSDAVGCTADARRACTQIDSRLCGQPVGSPSPSVSSGPNTSPGPGQPITFNFRIENPIGGTSDLMGLIRAISQWIFNLAIPVAVIFIIYGGLQFLLAGANPAMATKGKQTLKYAILGLVIVFIGYGFVTLIESIIKLGGSGPNTSPITTARPSSSTNPSTSVSPSVNPSASPSPSTLPVS